MVVDTHLYLMEYTLRTGDGNLREYLGHIRHGGVVVLER